MFDPIKNSDVVKQKHIENPNIGVLNLETYIHTVEGYSMVYTGGLYCETLSTPYIVYINENTLNSDEIILNLIDEMFKPKYKNILWYCHNFGNYDAPFMLKAVIKYNKTDIGKTTPYFLEPVFKDNSLLKIKIGEMFGKNK